MSLKKPSSLDNPNDDDEETTMCCPICLCEEDDDDDDEYDNSKKKNRIMTHGPCGHSLCMACMERLLVSHKNKAADQNTPNPSTRGRRQRREYYNDPDAHMMAPTVGRCPLCRSELSLFELYYTTPTPTTTTTPPTPPPTTPKLVVEKDYNIHQSEIVGLVFARDGQLGYASYHFPPPSTSSSSSSSSSCHTTPRNNEQEKDHPKHSTTSSSSSSSSSSSKWNKLDSCGRPLPYVSYEHVGMDMNLDDGSTPPIHKHFEEGCHFHTKTRTFHGTLKWTTTSLAAVGNTSTTNSSNSSSCCNGAATRPQEEETEEMKKQDIEKDRRVCHSSSSTVETTSSTTSLSSPETTTTTWHGAKTWDVILQFSSDLRYISNGILVKRREIPTGMQHPWPLDGRWKVTLDSHNDNNDDEDDEEVQYIEVRGGEYRLGSFLYTVDMTNPSSPQVTWPMTHFSGDTTTLQTAISGVNLITHPEGPAIGETIVWRTTTTHPQQQPQPQDPPRIVWTRQSHGEDVSTAYRVERFGPRDLWYQQYDENGGGGGGDNGQRQRRTMPTYHAETLWGNTFIQALKVGLASYHFISPPPPTSTTTTTTTTTMERGTSAYHAYISYEHPRCGEWPPLDDGSPIPSRVPFRNIQWDPTRRLFQGCILWEEDYGTRWQGASKWIYTIQFDTDFMCIVSGTVQTVLPSTRSSLGHRPEEEEDGTTVQDMSTFGDTLVYINAAITEQFTEFMNDDPSSTTTVTPSVVSPLSPQQDITNDHDVSLENSNSNSSSRGSHDPPPPRSSPQRYTRFRTIVQDLKQRLESEGVSVRTMAMIHHVFVMWMQQPSLHHEHVIDYNLS